MSKILVDTIDTRSGTSTLTLGASNAGTIALGSGDVQSNFLYPAFEAYLSASQTGIAHETFTKITFNTELFDEGGHFDTSNNRFTPPVGKYLIYVNLFTYDTNAGSSNLMRRGRVALYKNGSIMSNPQINSGWQGDANGQNPDAEMQTFSVHGSVIINQTTATDYYEVFGYIGNDNGDSNNGVSNDGSVFYGYRIGT